MSPNKPISIADFAAAVASQTDQAGQRRRLDAVMANRERASRAGKTLGGSVLLLTAARLQAVFADFPTRLDLASDNGYRRGLAAVFSRDPAYGPQGVWQIDAPDYHFSTDGIDQMRPLEVYRAALKAMGIPHSPEAMAALATQAAWPTDDHDRFFAALSQSAQALPYEIRRRLPGHGVRLAEALGGPADIFGKAFATKFAEWMLGGGTGVPFIDDAGRCPLHYLAAQHDQIQLGAVLEALRAKAPPPFAVDTRDGRGQTPLMLAVEHGHMANATLLIRAGANRHMADNRGDTLAHFAAHLTVSDAEDGLAMFRFLDSFEQPLDRPNKEGLRAADMISNLIATAQDDDVRPETLTKLEEIQSFLDDRKNCTP